MAKYRKALFQYPLQDSINGLRLQTKKQQSGDTEEWVDLKNPALDEDLSLIHI